MEWKLLRKAVVFMGYIPFMLLFISQVTLFISPKPQIATGFLLPSDDDAPHRDSDNWPKTSNCSLLFYSSLSCLLLKAHQGISKWLLSFSNLCSSVLFSRLTHHHLYGAPHSGFDSRIHAQFFCISRIYAHQNWTFTLSQTVNVISNKVNLQKTKVIIFRSSEKHPMDCEFRFRGTAIEIIQNFC